MFKWGSRQVVHSPLTLFCRISKRVIVEQTIQHDSETCILDSEKRERVRGRPSISPFPPFELQNAPRSKRSEREGRKEEWPEEMRDVVK